MYRRGGMEVTRAEGGIAVRGEADPAVVARVFDTGARPRARSAATRCSRARRGSACRARGAGGSSRSARCSASRSASPARAGPAEKLVAGLGDGGRFPTPEAVAEGELPGMPASRARALRALATAVADGLRLDPPLDLAATRAALLALPGFGPWTVEYIAMRALRDPDAWPGTDLWLRRAATRGRPGALAAVARVRGDGACGSRGGWPRRPHRWANHPPRSRSR